MGEKACRITDYPEVDYWLTPFLFLVFFLCILLTNPCLVEEETFEGREIHGVFPGQKKKFTLGQESQKREKRGGDKEEKRGDTEEEERRGGDREEKIERRR